MMMSRFCNRETIAKLWAQKDLLDDLFDANDGQVYYSFRDKLYPEDKTHGNGSANRTGISSSFFFSSSSLLLLLPLLLIIISFIWSFSIFYVLLTSPSPSHPLSPLTGRKFEQILEAIPVLEGLEDIFFLDVCGSPGSFSQVLLHRDSQAPCKGKGRGWGVSLLQKGGLFFFVCVFVYLFVCFF